MYSREELKKAMDNTAPLPKTAGEVRAVREKLLQSRDAIGEYEAKIATAQQTRNYWNYETLLENLEKARATLTDTQHELARIGSYGASLEAAENAKKQAAAQEHQRDQAQLEFATEQEAESKAEYQRRYLANGGTPERFEIAWPALWEAELHKRTVQGTDALRARLLQSGKYS